METFFMQNSEIQEWVDLFIEKLFTVCLLGNSNVDSELYSGRLAVEKIAYALQTVTDLSDESLNEGIHQIIEQRLPDPRVAENFPQFYNLMEELIRSGISSTHQNEIPPLQINANISTGMPSSRIVLKQGSEHGESSLPINIPKSIIKNEDYAAIPVLAPIPDLTQDQANNISELNEPIIEMAESSPSELSSEVAAPLETSAEQLIAAVSESILNTIEPSQEDEISQPDLTAKTIELDPTSNIDTTISHAPAGEERLSKLLKQIYPESNPLWNVMIGGHPIFAQVSELLIYIQSETEEAAEQTSAIEKNMHKLGYYVAFLQKQDLAYPRRMERSIRQALRKERKSHASTSFLR